MGVLEIAVLLSAVTALGVLPFILYLIGGVIIYRKWRYAGLLVYATLAVVFWLSDLFMGGLAFLGVLVITGVLMKIMFVNAMEFSRIAITGRIVRNTPVETAPPETPDATAPNPDTSPPGQGAAAGPATALAKNRMEEWQSGVDILGYPSDRGTDAFWGKHVHTANELSPVEQQKFIHVIIWESDSATPSLEVFDTIEQMVRRFDVLPSGAMMWIRHTILRAAYGLKVREKYNSTEAEPWEFSHFGWHPIGEKHPANEEAQREEAGGLDQF